MQTMHFRLITIFLLLALVACSSAVPSPTPTLLDHESQGQIVFKNYCSNCHSTSSDTVIVGPSLAGIATRGGGRIEGMDAQAYIRDSILNPNAYTVDSFPEGIMPLNMKDALSSEDLDAVVAYLLTLK
jgi:cytochrome c2